MSTQRGSPNKPQKLAIDFTIHYRKKLGGLSPKVFKLREVNIAPKATLLFKKTQRMQDFTTRKHYSGKHKVVIKVNGNNLAEKSFELTEK